MARSTVGDSDAKQVLDTRTSAHTWIGHSRHPYGSRSDCMSFYLFISLSASFVCLLCLMLLTSSESPGGFYTDEIVARVERKLFEIGRSPLNGTEESVVFQIVDLTCREFGRGDAVCVL
jgi:hypothetical protein